jgi:lipopolysaccharide export system protein LptA
VRSEFKDPVTVFCDRVDYNWRTNIAVATGNLTLKQNTRDGVTRTATAKKLTFYSREERLILEGDVNAVDSKGQKLKGPIATAIVREGAEEFRMDKGVIAEILIEDEDEPDNSSAPARPAPVAEPAVPTAPPATPTVTPAP